jgi:hypothetical protein
MVIRALIIKMPLLSWFLLIPSLQRSMCALQVPEQGMSTYIVCPYILLTLPTPVIVSESRCEYAKGCGYDGKYRTRFLAHTMES